MLKLMIIDKLQKLLEYCPPQTKDAISGILDKLNDYSVGEYIINKNIVIKRLSVTTVPINETIIEDHDHHIDIQIPLNAPELMNIYEKDGAQETMHDSFNDITTYAQPGTLLSSAHIAPGYFILLNPNELHQPQIAISSPYLLEKIVIKIDVF